jgi:hypothetical protein
MSQNYSGLSEALEGFSIKSNPHIKYDESMLVDSLDRILRYVPRPHEREKREEMIAYTIDEWFTEKMRKKYEELSPELFKLERKIYVSSNLFERRDGDKFKGRKKILVEIPMFLEANIEQDRGWEKVFEEQMGSYTYRYGLNCERPKIPTEVKKIGMEAVSMAYQTYADSLETDVIKEVVEGYPEHVTHPRETTLSVLWKPKPSDLQIKVERIDKDPALLLRYNRPYLVTTWIEPNEEPFMSFIDFYKRSNLDKYIKPEENL